jgi:hypothetical protein
MAGAFWLRRKSMKLIKVDLKKIILICLLLIISLVVWWASNQSRMEVIIEDLDNVQAELLNQKTTEVKSLELENGDILQTPKGTYEISTTSKNGTYFEVISTGGFFKKTQIVIKSEPENKNRFVATNPNNCGYLNGNYVSYDCGASLRNLSVHLSANENTPSYPRSNVSFEGLGDLGNVFIVEGKRYAILKGTEQRQVGRNSLYEITNDSTQVNATAITTLDSLSSTRLFFGEPYKSGFVAYEKSLGEMYYYKNLSTLSDAIYLKAYLGSDFESLDSAEVNANNDLLVVSANNINQIDRKFESTVVKIGDENSADTYRFSEILTNVRLCAEDTLCAQSQGDFVTYDIGERSVKKKNTVKGIKNYQLSGIPNEVYLIKNGSVIKFDVLKKSGFTSLSFPGFESNYISPTNNGYIVHVESTNITAAVFVNNETSDGNIMGLLNSLESLNVVDGLSVYANTVFITPNLGDFVFYEAEGYFDYSSESKTAANQQIQAIINASGIDTSNFKFVNLIN